MRFPGTRQSALLLLLASLASLGFAFIMQYAFHYEPCVLCLWQRLPFAVAILLMLIALAARPYARALLGLTSLAFVIGAALALFHSGVERGWWSGTAGCAIQPLHGGNPENWREQLLQITVARCDEISWTFLGLSMANWNIPFSLALALFSGAVWQRKRA